MFDYNENVNTKIRNMAEWFNKNFKAVIKKMFQLASLNTLETKRKNQLVIQENNKQMEILELKKSNNPNKHNR